MPTNTQRGNHPQAAFLSAVRESQTAFVDVVRSWADITEHLTRRLSLPVAGIDFAGAVDRTFDLAEQTLAAQRQVALTLVGVVDRQVDTVVETVESSAHQSLREIEGLLREAGDEQPQPAGRERSERPRPTADKAEAPTGETRKQNGAQDTKPDRRGFEERSVEELRDRARELEIEGRGSMSRDELITALRQPKQPKGDAQKATARTQDSKIDRRPFAERSVDELRDRARELEIEGRSSMSKDELIAALREHAK